MKLLDVYTKKTLSSGDNGVQWYGVTTGYFTKNYLGELTIDFEESLGFDQFKITELPADITSLYMEIIKDYLKIC